MITSIKRKLRESHQIVVLHCKIMDDASYQFRYVQMEKKGSKVSITLELKESTHWEIVSKQLNRKTPVALLISGKGILLRETELSDENAINRALPGVDPKEYSSVNSSLENKSFVSLARRKLIEQVGDQITKDGFQVVSVIPGFGGLIELVHRLLPNESSVDFDDWTFERANNRIHQKQTHENLKYKIGDQYVDSHMLPSFLCGLSFWMDSLNASWQPELILQGKSEMEFGNQFRRLIAVGVFVIFGLLVLNFLYWSSLQKDEQALMAQMGTTKPALDNLKVLENELKEKKVLVDNLGLARNVDLSLLADKIGQSLPEEIVLSRIALCPVEGKVKVEEEIKFGTSRIVLSGETQKGSSVNTWLTILSKETWAKHVELVRYETRQGIGYFEMNLDI